MKRIFLQSVHRQLNHLRCHGCIINKPTLSQVCEHMESIERVGNISHTKMADGYIIRDIPVIVTDGVTNWPAQRLFTLKFLYEVMF